MLQKNKLIFILLLLAPGSGVASGWEFSGYLGIDYRGFWETSQHHEQDGHHEVSVSLQPEARWRSDNGNQRINLLGYTRLDSRDNARSHLDLREAYWATEGVEWDLLMGVNKVFWGVAESRHLVDVINQSDLVEDIDAEAKLGQPMINLNLQRDWGLIELYLLPGFRERTFSGSDGRLRSPLVISDKSLYESSAGDHHVDQAIRYSHYFGDVDLGVSLFNGTSREPRFVLQNSQLIPVYDQLTQLGFDLQYTRDAWLWKFEGLLRQSDIDNYGALVAGVEYTFFGVSDSGADIGVLVEWLYDERGPLAPPTIFDDDYFLGTRLAINDVNDTSLLVGMVLDLDTGEQLITIEAETRLRDQLTGQLRLRMFSGDEALKGIDQDDYLEIGIKWYF
jgi:hypothetical protein